MLFNRFLKRTIAFLSATVLIVSFILPVCTVNAKENKDLSISLDYGYSGYVDSNSYAPFRVTVQNKGEDFEGSVWLVFTYGEGSTNAYEQKISLASGSTKKVSFVPLVKGYIQACTIRITDKEGKKVKSKTFTINCEMYNDSIRVGVLSDDYTIFGAKLTGTFLPFDRIKLLPVKLSEEDILDDPKSLAPLSVIIISDYSTDRLTTAQRQAIMSHVAEGALLIVGTGTSAQKVLKAFPELSAVQLDELRNVEVTVNSTYSPLTSNDLDYTLMRDNGYDYDQRLDYLCRHLDVNTFKAPEFADYINDKDEYNDYKAWEYLYNTNSSAFIAAFWDWHTGDTYEDTLMYYGKSEIQQQSYDFQNYAVNTLCPEVINYYQQYIAPNITPSNASKEYIKTYITEPLSGDPVITGNTRTGESYALTTKIKYGSGYICPMAVDPSKDPYSTSQFFSASIAMIISDTVAPNVSAIKARGVGSFMTDRFTWEQENLADRLAIGKLIPVPVYLIIFAIYVVLGFVAYFYLRKRNRSIYLWAVQGVLALSATVLVMLTGLTTRMASPVVNGIKFTELTDNVAQETTIAAAILPKTKKYTLKFQKKYMPQLLVEDNNYYRSYRGNSLAPAPEGEYNIAILDEKDCNAISLYSTAALSKMPLGFSTQKDIKDYNIDIDAKYSNATLVGHVTNNTEFTMEGCVILMDYLFYPLGTLAPGETIDLSTVIPRSTFGSLTDDQLKKGYGAISTSRYFAFAEINYTKPDNFASYFVGFNRSEHLRSYLKSAALDYLLTSSSSDVSKIPTYLEISFGIFSAYQRSAPRSIKELYNSLNLDSNGYPMQLTATPYFIAFNADDTGSLFSDHSSAKENLLEVFYKAIPSIVE